ncbi:hypothetical protein [Taibaiella helva]|uniref:hypothetical protein n=1 Tax=Taibaiella helva TaxID=2301235 RepID=UPI000E596EFA|nr:hypothetical protein [Taibaiella helva]
MQTAADFQLTIDKIYEPDESYPGVDYIRVDYTIKNVSGKTVPPYGLKVHWRVKAADGAYCLQSPECQRFCTVCSSH